MADGSSKTPRADSKAKELPYNHFRIHRVDVEPMLIQNGDFILRNMRQNGIEKYAVSARWSGKIKHFPIQTVKDRYCFESRTFRRIKELIRFHIETGTPLTHASGARLERAQYRQSWELLTHQIEMKKLLGKGNFGRVFEAILTRTDGKKEIVAVKTLDNVVKEDDATVEEARVAMLEEARTMRALSGHPNIVKAEGVTIDKEHPSAVMEIVKGGCLEAFVRGNSLSMDEKMKLAMQAAVGLQHIHDRNYLHRDLAARNCLIEKVPVTTLKITDFGLAKQLGNDPFVKLSATTQMPVKWCALESLEQFIWTRESDVWSLGVLIWEIVSDGGNPYFEHEKFGRNDALTFLRSEGRLDIPPEVPKPVREILKRCWSADPSKRPKLKEVSETIGNAIKAKK